MLLLYWTYSVLTFYLTSREIQTNDKYFKNFNCTICNACQLFEYSKYSCDCFWKRCHIIWKIPENTAFGITELYRFCECNNNTYKNFLVLIWKNRVLGWATEQWICHHDLSNGASGFYHWHRHRHPMACTGHFTSPPTPEIFFVIDYSKTLVFFWVCFVCFFDPTCPPCSSIGLVPCAANLLSKFLWI